MSRDGKIAISWSADNRIGSVSVDGEYWAAVEWSEKRQQWCVEDSQGQCLKHVASIRGAAASKDEAVALAEAMIADGRMPDPETAKAEHKERQRAARAKRQQQPAEIRRRERDRRYSDAMRDARRAEMKERDAPPLYETLAEAFDFSDPELWKSNSFTALKPRLALHLRSVIAKLEQELAYGLHRHGGRAFHGQDATDGKLAKARSILAQLEA